MEDNTKIIEQIQQNLPATEFKIRVTATKGDTVQCSGYYQAHTYREALDAIFGIENWETRYDVTYASPDHAAAVCSLTVTFPDGTSLTKSGVGTGSDAKNASSDALKRACMELGISRKLWSLGNLESPKSPKGKYPVNGVDVAKMFLYLLGHDAQEQDEYTQKFFDDIKKNKLIKERIFNRAKSK